MKVETIPLRMAVAVASLVDAGFSGPSWAGHSEELSSALVAEAHHVVVERGMLSDANQELAIQENGILRRSEHAKLGRQLGASMF